MPRKSIKRAQPWTISLAYGPNGESRYYVGPANGVQETKFSSFQDAKSYVHATLWKELWSEQYNGAKWAADNTSIADYPRVQQNSDRQWTIYPTIELMPKKFRWHGTNVPSRYLIRLPGSARWRRVKTDWDGTAANHHIYVGGPEGALRIDLQ